MFAELYTYLKEKGFDVYSIGQHQGTCSSPYLVIKENGESDIAGTSYINYVVEILVYYPMGSYSLIRIYTDKLKKEMSGFKALRRVLAPMPTIIDDDKKAYMTSYTYKKIKMKEGRLNG